MKKTMDLTGKRFWLSADVTARSFLRFALTSMLAALFCAPLFAEQPLQLSSVLLTVTETAEVSAARAGILAKLLIREGTIVQPKQLVAELDNAKALLAVDEAQLAFRMAKQVADDDVDVRYAHKTYEQAVSELRRSVAVNSDLPGTISARELDLLQLTVERGELEIERAEKEHRLANMKLAQHQASVRLAEIELAEHSFLAPIGGMVVSVSKRSGEWIEPGDIIVKVVRIDRIRAEGFLAAAQAKMNLTGRIVDLTVEVSESTTIRTQGKVTFVSPEVNPVNGMVRIWSEFDCDDAHLRPGLRGTVQIRSVDHKR